MAKYQGHFRRPGNLRDERGWITLDHGCNSVERFHKYLCHLIGAKIPRRKLKDPNFGLCDGGDFQLPMLKILIFCENNPTSMTNPCQPLLIGRIYRKMVVVNFDLGTCLAKLSRDRMFT